MNSNELDLDAPATRREVEIAVRVLTQAIVSAAPGVIPQMHDALEGAASLNPPLTEFARLLMITIANDVARLDEAIQAGHQAESKQPV